MGPPSDGSDESLEQLDLMGSFTGDLHTSRVTCRVRVSMILRVNVIIFSVTILHSE